MLISNYHTHTWRCRHADGTDTDFIETAIAAGLRTLGFSDHCPYVGNQYKGKMDDRMEVEQLPEYFETLSALREKYRDKIEILIGFEVEYFPKTFGDLWAVLSAYPPDFLILGQHYSLDWKVGARSFLPQTDPKDLYDYTDNVCAGIETGLYSCVAHPDVFNWCGDEKLYEAQARRICETAKKYAVPLELNSPGDDVGRYYPSERFFRIAADCKNEVIIGCDAHDPEKMTNQAGIERCEELIASLGLCRTDTLITLPQRLAAAGR